MSSVLRHNGLVWSPALARAVDQACVSFEGAWRHQVVKTGPPRLEEYLAGQSPDVRAILLQELLVIEIEYRLRANNRPSREEYARRFPAEVPIVEAALHEFGLPANAGANGAAEAATPTVIGPADEAEVPPSEAARVSLAVVKGPQKGREFAFTGHDTFIVGRSRMAHLRLKTGDRAISRYHCLIEVSPPRCRIMDMGSTNGTLVNGRQVRTADLASGDRIRLGRTELQVAISARDGLDAGSIYVADEPPPPARSPDPQADDVKAPPRIPGYRILRELGRGGMGIVYVAETADGGEHAAIKIIRPSMSATPRKLAQFLREARILESLRHPHIVAYRKMGESAGRLYFVMDYVDGCDAAGLLQQAGGPLAIPRAVSLVCQALEALAFAHARGFVHRDVKPSNILVRQVTGREQALIADFGLARAYQQSELSGLTVTGQTGGTVGYMAPEQILDFRRARPAADQYAAAATLYRLLTNHSMFDESGTRSARLLQILEQEPRPLVALRPDVPAGLAEAIACALSREPSDRFRDVTEFRHALLPFAR